MSILYGTSVKNNVFQRFASGGCLGGSWAGLGESWGCFGASCEHLGEVLEPSESTGRERF